jgi:hypothetical protein
MNDASEVKLKNDRPAMQGTCSVCGTKITVIGGKKAAEKTEATDKSDNLAGGDAGGKGKTQATTKAKAAAKS